MALFRSLFSRNEDAAEPATRPMGFAAAAEWGAERRQNVFRCLEEVEAELGQWAVATARDTGVLMVHPRLTKEIRKRPDRHLIEPALYICFPAPAASRVLNEQWPSRVKTYHLRPNTETLLREKAALLVAFITHNLDAALESRKEQAGSPELTEEQISRVRLEEAMCWYRVVYEMAYRYLSRQQWSLFMDWFADWLADNLALQGMSPEVLCRARSDRLAEYGQYREWAPGEEGGTAGCLLWEAGKHVGDPIGAGGDPIFLMTFTRHFVKRVNDALVSELLTGSEARLADADQPRV